MKQVQRRKKNQNRSLLFFKNKVELLGFLFLLLVLGMIAWTGWTIKRWMEVQEHSVISKLVITGDRVFTSDDDVRQAILSLEEGNTFVTQDVDMVQKEVLRIPWIKQVSVRKQWPDTIKLHMIEYVPLVRWNDIQFLDPFGHVFSLPAGRLNDEPFPYLYGPNGREREVLTMYRRLKSLMDENHYQTDLSITHLNVNERFSWELVINNHYRLELGRTNIETRLQRFLDIYPEIIAPMVLDDGIIHVDLRYQSGMAIDTEKRY